MTLPVLPLPPDMYIYIYKICIYFTYIKYIYIHIYVSIFLCLPAKTGHKRGSCLQFIKFKKSAREHRNGGFHIWIWTIFIITEYEFAQPFPHRKGARLSDSSTHSFHKASFGQPATRAWGADSGPTWFTSGSTCYFSIKKNNKINIYIYLLKKLYWKGGWQELVQFSFQHFWNRF